MRDISTVEHHPVIEEIVDLLCLRTQNNDRAFFRVPLAYFFGKMAASQRATLVTKDRGEIPVNIYALSLAVSGAGKGHSINLIEDGFLEGFRSRFLNETFPEVANSHLLQLAQDRALRKDKPEEEELERVNKEFKRLGALAFTFDSGTTPAVKQMRQKLLMANAGSINMQIDEIGSNLISNTEVLNAFLELYYQGKIKQKLTKNTAENERMEELDGKTPTNMLLFGTPTKLLDGAKTEDEFYSFLETGYARRCLFSYGHRYRAAHDKSPEEIYRQLTDNKNAYIITKWADHFTNLADPDKFGWKIYVEDDVGIELMKYKVHCERLSDRLPEHEEIQKAELSHRYFKALKLVGAYAFVDGSSEITMDTLYHAIKLVEESGAAFERIFTREKVYAKLAKYLAETRTEVTHADLTEALPFYKGSQTHRNELMTLAGAWGYRNAIIIRKTYEQGIEFFKGESLDEVNLDKLKVSYGTHVAYDYLSEEISFKNLGKLVGSSGYHWINHFLTDGEKGTGHRQDEKVIPGFDLVVLDVDTGFSLDAAKDLLQDYTYLIHTTKRHTDKENRFRIILPMNYRLELDTDDYREFMKNVFSWLPFEPDTQTAQRARKWECFNGQQFYNEGQLIDALQFIPKTARNDEFRENMVKLENLGNLERWFAQRMVTGNRNNLMLRFAMILVDSGMSYNDIEDRVIDFNSKLDNKLSENELRSTVLVTAARKIHSNNDLSE